MLITGLMICLIAAAFGFLLLAFKLGDRLAQPYSIWGVVLSLLGLVICGVAKFGVGMFLFLVVACSFLVLYTIRGIWREKVWLTVLGFLLLLAIGGHTVSYMLTEPVAFIYNGQYHICADHPLWWTEGHPSRSVTTDCSSDKNRPLAERVVYPEFAFVFLPFAILFVVFAPMLLRLRTMFKKSDEMERQLRRRRTRKH